jgi:DNA-binding NarL/FixJ family response regulator
MLALMLGQLLVRSLPFAPAILREFGITTIAYYLAITILVLIYALRYLFQPEKNTNMACALPDQFVQKYGISPRECEIVSMIVQGSNNRKIGEALFISALTVKNHVYHIYQKTGARNKIQLLNLINSLK